MRVTVRRLLACLAALAGCLQAGAALAEHVNVNKVDGVLSAATADFVQKAIDLSEADGANALLI